jgi:hypothetical protein
MRSFSRRLLVPALLAVAALTAPATATALTPHDSVRATARAAGIYRLTLTAKNRPEKSVHLVIREIAHGMDGVLLSDENESWLSAVRVDGDTLRATVSTSEGEGEIMLLVTDTLVSGTLTVGHQQIAIRGERSA